MTASSPDSSTLSDTLDTGNSSNGRPAGDDSSGQTSVFVVDDHPPIRDAMGDAIDSTIDLQVCGHAERLGEARGQIGETAPDVVVVDISLPDGHGLELVKTVRERRPEIRSVVFSMYDETIYAERALRAGASGYLMKTEPIGDLVEAVRRAERGEITLSRSMTTTVLRTGQKHDASAFSFAIDELTGRERQVLERIGEGQSIEDIQEELGLCRKTVETYRRRAKEKLGLDTVRELVQYAVQWTHGPDPAPPEEAQSDT
mgnify:CR=1 FL=1